MQGQIDLISPEGVIEGWCWNERAPNERVGLVVKVDGEEVGSTVASQYREDLSNAGIGDGRHFFQFILPKTVLAFKRTHSVTLAHAETGQSIGNPYTFFSSQTLSFDDRLLEVETRTRLLEGQISALRRGRGTQDEQAELFAVVGAYFARLSRDMARGVMPTLEAQLTDTVQALTSTHPPISFSPQERPVISVFVDASCSLDQAYRCLSSLKRATSGISTLITVIDTGTFDDVSLLPVVLKGVRYIRANDDLVPELVEAGRLDKGQIILFLSGRAIVDKTLIAEIMAVLKDVPDIGAVGSCVYNQPENVRHGGFRSTDGNLEPVSIPNEEGDVLIVDALASHVAAFQGEAFRAAGGMDHVFGNDIASAIIDLCFRLKNRSALMTALTATTADLMPGSAPYRPRFFSESRTGELLRQRWLRSDSAEFPSLFAGAEK